MTTQTKNQRSNVFLPKIGRLYTNTSMPLDVYNQSTIWNKSKIVDQLGKCDVWMVIEERRLHWKVLTPRTVGFVFKDDVGYSTEEYLLPEKSND